MDRRTEKAIELVERAQNLGVRLEFDSGLLVLVKRKDSSHSEFIVELGKYLGEVRRLVEGRAMAARANDFLGQHIWSEDGEGVLASASGDGELSVTVVREGFRNPQTLTAKAETLLLVLDEEDCADDAASLHGDESKSEPRGIFGRLRRARKD